MRRTASLGRVIIVAERHGHHAAPAQKYPAMINEVITQEPEGGGGPEHVNAWAMPAHVHVGRNVRVNLYQTEEEALPHLNHDYLVAWWPELPTAPVPERRRAAQEVRE